MGRAKAQRAEEASNLSFEEMLEDYNEWPSGFVKREALRIFHESEDDTVKLEALKLVADEEKNGKSYSF